MEARHDRGGVCANRNRSDTLSESETIRGKELRDHMEDQTYAFLTKGMSEEEARDQAVREMGIPLRSGRSWIGFIGDIIRGRC